MTIGTRPGSKAQPYRVLAEWRPGLLKSEVMEGPDAALLMCITSAINLINMLGLGLLSQPGCARVFKGRALKGRLLFDDADG